MKHHLPHETVAMNDNQPIRDPETADIPANENQPAGSPPRSPTGPPGKNENVSPSTRTTVERSILLSTGSNLYWPA